MIHPIPEPGDIGLTSVLGPVGWGIRLGQLLLGDGAAPYEHAFLVLDGGELIEAQPGGAVVRPLAEYDGRHVLYVAPASLTDGQREAICAKAKFMVGTPYSFFDYLSLALLRLHIRPGRVRRYVSDSHHMICSELVDFCYLKAGVHLFNDGRIPGDVTPADLANLLME